MALKRIYIHIPFCKKKCIYCDFYSINLIKKKEEFLKYLIKEIDLRYKKEDVSSIYFGGGTPSLLSPFEIKEIISKFKLKNNCEITLECNPDDLSKEKILNYLKGGVNRFSIGIQSLNERDLKILKRRHNKKDNLKVLKILNKICKNWSCDLIIGIKGQNKEKIKNNLMELWKYKPPHISIYPLEIKKNKKISLPIDEKAKLLKFTWDFLKKQGYIHYEISNFSLKGFESKHNLGYWLRDEYYGFGPSAHSFLEEKRFFNFNSIEKYIERLKKDKLPMSRVYKLKEDEIFWEFFILNLRTNRGFPLKYFKNFGFDYLEKEGFLKKKKEKIYLTDKGMLVYNEIILKLKEYLSFKI